MCVTGVSVYVCMSVYLCLSVSVSVCVSEKERVRQGPTTIPTRLGGSVSFLVVPEDEVPFFGGGPSRTSSLRGGGVGSGPKNWSEEDEDWVLCSCSSRPLRTPPPGTSGETFSCPLTWKTRVGGFGV